MSVDVKVVLAAEADNRLHPRALLPRRRCHPSRRRTDLGHFLMIGRRKSSHDHQFSTIRQKKIIILITKDLLYLDAEGVEYQTCLHLDPRADPDR